jgi:hypothetical protein
MAETKEKAEKCPFRSFCGYWEKGKCYRQPPDSSICSNVYAEAYTKGWADALQAVKEGREIIPNEPITAEK